MKYLRESALIPAFFLASACQVQQNASPLSEVVPEAPETVPTPADPAFFMTDAAIIDTFSSSSCDAFGGGDSEFDPDDPSSYLQGLHGTISVPPAGFRSNTGAWNNLNKFASDGIVLDQDLFFTWLNVPTRSFTSGFPKFDGSLIKDDEGQDLVEYFRIDFDGLLVAPNNFRGGNFEFAFLSDDGARLKIDGQTLIDHPSTTPTKMMCGTQTVSLMPGDIRRLEVDYFQGPRHHIAMVLLWREAGQGTEPLCGSAGNETWFDYQRVLPVPKMPYFQLLSRGWQPVGPEHLRLPVGQAFNPCRSARVQEVFARN